MPKIVIRFITIKNRNNPNVHQSPDEKRIMFCSLSVVVNTELHTVAKSHPTMHRKW